MTTIDSFRSSVSAATPPGDVGPALQALWWLAKGDWNEAHKVVQQHEDQRSTLGDCPQGGSR